MKNTKLATSMLKLIAENPNKFDIDELYEQLQKPEQFKQVFDHLVAIKYLTKQAYLDINKSVIGITEHGMNFLNQVKANSVSSFVKKQASAAVGNMLIKLFGWLLVIVATVTVMLLLLLVKW